MEVEALIGSQDYIDPEMLEVAIEYWYKGQEDRRSPFPDYIKSDLRKAAIIGFLDWSKKLSPDAKKEINDEILAERFEEFLFEEAYKMVMTEDEKITVKYPFMLRVEDRVNHDGKPASIVVKREITKQGDNTYLKVIFEEEESGKLWDTLFELPE